MKYALNSSAEGGGRKVSALASLKKFVPLLSDEKVWLGASLVAILINSGLTVLAPVLVGHAVDKHIVTRDYDGVVWYLVALFAIYLGMLASGFLQTRIMGGVGQRILFRLRGVLFDRLQELPVAFFSQNKSGDLISRINNDTDKLNMFFSRSLMQFVGNVFVIIGAALAMVVVNAKLGGAALLPALGLLIIIGATSGWIKRKNSQSLKTLGGLSAEIQESLENFRVIIAFNRRDYFRRRFAEVNEENYRAALVAGVANNTYTPIFGLASNAGMLIVIAYGLHLIAAGQFTFGLLISYFAYVSRFYDPLRQMAQLWSDFQGALAAWERISEILALRSDLPVVASEVSGNKESILEFRGVSFGYPNGKMVLSDISFSLRPGKTYALVGPTGGGKTTTASLMARLYDPTSGSVLLAGKDIRSYEAGERTKKIGFILQDPFLFSGTVRDNITYGNEAFAGLATDEVAAALEKEGLADLLSRFENGLDTHISSAGEGISLGQKQLVAFMRAALRHPDLLILDEATANIDTVTEQLLDEILKRLPAKTARVIIAHRLNTIESADEIFFVNGGSVVPAGSLQRAVEMLEKGTRES